LRGAKAHHKLTDESRVEATHAVPNLIDSSSIIWAGPVHLGSPEGCSGVALATGAAIFFSSPVKSPPLPASRVVEYAHPPPERQAGVHLARANAAASVC